MRIVITILVIASLCSIGKCGWNEFFGDTCNPAKYHEENSGYCVDYFQGWWDGGAIVGEYEYDKPRCYKGSEARLCKCNDCGSADTQCKDWRCDDNHGFEIDGKCYKKNQNGALEEVSLEIYDNCYKGFGECTPCPIGQRRVGCMRKSSGQCEACPAAPEGFFFDTKGSCNIAMCLSPQPGQYIETPCAQGANTVIKSCSEHPNNKQIPPNKFYCPGNNEVKAIAANSYVNTDFTNYICNDGYYRDFDLCRACPPGTCCVNQIKYDCPEHYFASGNANSKCTKCNMECTGVDKDKLRRRCPKNSIQNSERCISCGLCGEWPATGYNCVLQPSDFKALPTTCCNC